MSEINDKLSFNKWYAPLGKPLKDKFKDLIVLSNPELSANPTNFFTNDKLVLEVKGESKEQTRWRLVNEWRQKLEVMDTSPVATKEEERGDITDITDITDMPETEVVNDIPTPKPKDIEVAKDISSEQEAEDIATAVDNKQEAEPVLSQPTAYHGTVGPPADLLNALSNYIAEGIKSGFFGTPEDLCGPPASVQNLVERIEKLEEENAKLKKKQASLFNAMRDL